MTATSSPAEPPESTLAAEIAQASHIERMALDMASSVFGWQHLVRYSGMSADWLDLTLLAIVRSALAAHHRLHVAAATPTAARVAELEAALAAAEAREAGIRFRVEVACDGYSALTDADVPMADGGGFDEDPDSYIAGAKVAADEIRAALTPPQPAP